MKSNCYTRQDMLECVLTLLLNPASNGARTKTDHCMKSNCYTRQDMLECVLTLLLNPASNGARTKTDHCMKSNCYTLQDMLECVFAGIVVLLTPSTALRHVTGSFCIFHSSLILHVHLYEMIAIDSNIYVCIYIYIYTDMKEANRHS